MSLPPQTVGLVSDFLAALTGLFYVVGGFYLGKWQSDKSEFQLFSYLRPVVLHAWSQLPDRMLDELFRVMADTLGIAIDRSILEQLSKSEEAKKLRSIAMKDIKAHLDKADEQTKSLEKSIGRSKWIGITCVAVGTALFVVRLML